MVFPKYIFTVKEGPLTLCEKVMLIGCFKPEESKEIVKRWPKYVFKMLILENPSKSANDCINKVFSFANLGGRGRDLQIEE